MKKYIYGLFLTIVAGGFTGCLDLKPESELTFNGYWTSEEAVNAAQIGLHSKLRDYDDLLWRMGEVRSDIWGASTLETGFDTELINNNITTSQTYFGKWAEFYGLMHNLNDFIKNAPSVTFKNPKQLDYMMGEAYGMRAFVYYTLLKAYGAVPITTEPMIEVDLMKLKKKRSPKADVMAQIKSDIAKSLEYFGDNNSLMSGKSVYWSKSATLALKGDAYLWSGKVLGGGQADFTEAKAALSAVSGFELVAYDKLWGVDNKNNKEFIFAFDYNQLSKTNIYGAYTTAANQYIKPLFDENGTPMSNVILYGAAATVINGANRYCPTDKMLSALSDKNDKRYNTFIRMYDKDKKYRAAMLYKFMGPVNSGGVRESANNVPIYRYADVLLLLAEAKNQLGEDPTAEINKIRERAYGSTTYPKFVNGSKAENAKVILDERLKEFAGEGKRWWDLVRAGDDFLYNEVATMTKATAYKIYYSLPESMLADDSELEQTEGYTK